MVRKIMTEKEKRKRKKRRIFIFLFLFLVLGGLGFFMYEYVYKKANPKVQEAKEIDKVETKNYDYKYSLTDLDSKYYQAEFKNLKEILMKDEVDEEAYATQLAKCFVIDLYTLSTKVNKYDIGGEEFFYSDKKDEYAKQVMNTLYDAMLDNSYKDRKQNLPEVKEATVNSVEKMTYKLGNTGHDAYQVKINITYVADLGADKEVTVVLVKEEDGKKFGVVDVQNTFNPKY